MNRDTCFFQRIVPMTLFLNHSVLLLCQLPKLQNGDEETIYSESDFEGASEKVKARIQLLVNKGIPLTAATLRKIDIRKARSTGVDG